MTLREVHVRPPSGLDPIGAHAEGLYPVYHKIRQCKMRLLNRLDPPLVATSRRLARGKLSVLVRPFSGPG